MKGSSVDVRNSTGDLLPLRSVRNLASRQGANARSNEPSQIETLIGVAARLWGKTRFTRGRVVSRDLRRGGLAPPFRLAVSRRTVRRINGDKLEPWSPWHIILKEESPHARGREGLHRRETSGGSETNRRSHQRMRNPAIPFTL